MSGYVGGRLKRIKIKNFMTYDNVEIYPKKGLNLVIGTNGTGKSSIMCAICLGLAGKPQFTGRATQLAEFIKHGCKEAEVEIELESKKNSVVIRRKIKEDSSEWFLNKVRTNQNEVASAIKKFNIDTSNLCQFLPQEKVVEFSRMDKKQRLENMLQAIGEPHLFELFNELKNLYRQFSDKEQEIKRCQSRKNSAVEENSRISDEVQKQEKRKRLKEDLQELHKQKKLITYQNIYNEFTELKKQMEMKKQSVAKLQQERNEAVSQEEQIYKSYVKFSNKFKEYNNKKKKIMNDLSVTSNHLTTLNEQVENEKIEYRNKLKEKAAQTTRLEEIDQLVEGLKLGIAKQKNKYATINENVNSNSQALAALQLEINELHQLIQRAVTEKNRWDYSASHLRSQLASLQDEQNKKLENLKRRDKPTYEATCWVLKNRQSFKSNVYLPIMLEINIKSNEYSKYVENVIGFRDMIAFVCEDKSDCERLTEILKKQMKLPVNIVMAPDTSLSNYKLPSLNNEQRKCGLECFVKDLFTAPEPIMKYLYTCCGIHCIPVARSVINSVNIEFILQSFNLFFSENMRISGKRSRYGQRNLSIKKDFITSKKLLVEDCNDELQQGIKQKLQQIQVKIEEKARELEEYNAKVAEKEQRQEMLRQEKKCLQDQKRKIENLSFQLIQKEKFRSQISVLIDEEEEKAKTIRKIQSINEKRNAVLNEFNSLNTAFVPLENNIIEVILKMNYLSKQLKLYKSSHEDIHDRVRAAEIELEQTSKEFLEKKHIGKRLVNEIKLLGSITVVEQSLEDIEAKIHHLQAELSLNEDNEPLITEYNNRQRKIGTIQQQIDSLEDTLNDVKQDIEGKKKEWLEPLQHHIRNINRKFSHYFKQMNCAGEISLDIPEIQNDFIKYGLQIRLKFHDDDPFSELSSTRHSGGECSVAAIIFILSLQELTEVPFRCIDEINQGMDSVNERKIYQLVADSVAQDRCSQYFLLTPKLLHGLEYPDDIAVHIIFNSYFLSKKLDLKKHLEIAHSV